MSSFIHKMKGWILYILHFDIIKYIIRDFHVESCFDFQSKLKDQNVVYAGYNINIIRM